MEAREVIAEELRRMGSFLPHDEAGNILLRLRTNGFTIMSKEDVEAVRDRALEEAAVLIETHAYTDGTGGRRLQPAFHVKYDLHHKTIAAAIRLLKSAGRDGKEAQE